MLKLVMTALADISRSWLMGLVVAIVLVAVMSQLAYTESQCFVGSIARERGYLETKLREANMPEPQITAISRSLNTISWRTSFLARNLSTMVLPFIAIVVVMGSRMDTQIRAIQNQLKEMKK